MFLLQAVCPLLVQHIWVGSKEFIGEVKSLVLGDCCCRCCWPPVRPTTTIISAMIGNPGFVCIACSHSVPAGGTIPSRASVPSLVCLGGCAERVRVVCCWFGLTYVCVRRAGLWRGCLLDNFELGVWQHIEARLSAFLLTRQKGLCLAPVIAVVFSCWALKSSQTC